MARQHATIALACPLLRVLMLQLCRDQVEPRLHLPYRYTRPQPPNHFKGTMPAVIELGPSAFELGESRGGQKHIHLERALHDCRAVRHDSDHGACQLIESDCRAYDSHVGAELLSPDPFA